MTFKALQTYSNGQVVSWIDVPAAGSSDEPEHPAPTLKLAPVSGGAAPPAAPASSAPPASDDVSKGSVTGAYVLGGIGLVAGLAALALAASGRRRRSTVDGTRQPVSSSTGAH
jgi:hypothetical protein